MIINNPIVLDLREKPDFATVIFAVNKEAIKDYFDDINTVQVTKIIKEMKLDDKVIILAKCKKYSLVITDKEFLLLYRMIKMIV